LDLDPIRSGQFAVISGQWISLSRTDLALLAELVYSSSFCAGKGQLHAKWRDVFGE